MRDRVNDNRETERQQYIVFILLTLSHFLSFLCRSVLVGNSENFCHENQTWRYPHPICQRKDAMCVYVCDYFCRLYLRSRKFHFLKITREKCEVMKCLCVHVEYGRDQLEVPALCAMCLCMHTSISASNLGKMIECERGNERWRLCGWACRSGGDYVALCWISLNVHHNNWSYCVFKNLACHLQDEKKIQLLHSAWGHYGWFHNWGVNCLLHLQTTCMSFTHIYIWKLKDTPSNSAVFIYFY